MDVSSAVWHASYRWNPIWKLFWYLHECVKSSFLLKMRTTANLLDMLWNPLEWNFVGHGKKTRQGPDPNGRFEFCRHHRAVFCWIFYDSFDGGSFNNLFVVNKGKNPSMFMFMIGLCRWEIRKTMYKRLLMFRNSVILWIYHETTETKGMFPSDKFHR